MIGLEKKEGSSVKNIANRIVYRDGRLWVPKVDYPVFREIMEGHKGPFQKRLLRRKAISLFPAETLWKDGQLLADFWEISSDKGKSGSEKEVVWFGRVKYVSLDREFHLRNICEWQDTLREYPRGVFHAGEGVLAKTQLWAHTGELLSKGIRLFSKESSALLEKADEEALRDGIKFLLSYEAEGDRMVRSLKASSFFDNCFIGYGYADSEIPPGADQDRYSRAVLTAASAFLDLGCPVLSFELTARDAVQKIKEGRDIDIRATVGALWDMLESDVAKEAGGDEKIRVIKQIDGLFSQLGADTMRLFYYSVCHRASVSAAKNKKEKIFDNVLEVLDGMVKEDDPNMYRVGTLMMFHTAGEGKGMASGFYDAYLQVVSDAAKGVEKCRDAGAWESDIAEALLASFRKVLLGKINKVGFTSGLTKKIGGESSYPSVGM